MKLFCSECRCFFEDKDMVCKVESQNTFLYVHESCLGIGDRVVAILSTKKMIEALSGKYEGQKMYRKVCAYAQCEAVFVTKDNDRVFCNKECARLHFNEIKKLQNREKRRKIRDK